MDILSLLKKRRSHFRKEFTGKQIEDEKINYLLECAQQAPSHKLTLPWYFKVFSKQSLESLTNELLRIDRIYRDNEDPNKETIEGKIKSIPQDTSHVIAICMKRDPAKRVPEWEEIAAVACAVQNMYIGALQWPEVGVYWGTGNHFSSVELHAYLHLKEEDKCLGFFFIGEVTNKRYQASRPPISLNSEWL